MEDKTLFEIIKEGFEDARDWAEGKIKLRVTEFRDPGPPPKYDANDVGRIRNSLHLSQAAFAKFLGVSCKSVASWEQGARTPSGGTARLLQLIENPNVLTGLRVGPAFRSIDELDGGGQAHPSGEPVKPGKAAVRLESPGGGGRPRKSERKASTGHRGSARKPRTVAATAPKGVRGPSPLVQQKGRAKRSRG